MRSPSSPTWPALAPLLHPLAHIMPARMPILLIEDNADLREATRHLLEANGYIVVVASDGYEGLRHLRDGVKPSVILLDLRMPVMDGAAFRAEQVKDPWLRDIPVVVLSADRAVRHSALFRRVAHYSKPLDGDKLLDIVGRYAATVAVAPASGHREDVQIEIREPLSGRHLSFREVKGRPSFRGRSRGR